MAATNTTPSYDGDLTLYEPYADGADELEGLAIHNELQGCSVLRSRWTVLYVNGMRTTKATHTRTSRQLATIVGEPVHGIYNMTGLTGLDSNWLVNGLNFLVDAVQCVNDQTLRVGRTMDARTRLFLKVGRDPKAAGQILLRGNRAAQALFETLYSCAEKGTPTVVVCHSQGNLITANALWVLSAIRGNAGVGNVRVFGLASPNVSWPPNRQRGLIFNLYRHDADPITLISVPGIGEKPKTEKAFGWKMSYHDVTTKYFSRKDFQQDLHSTLKSG
jgi:hypothetical protein